jgi:hypothetical protein
MKLGSSQVVAWVQTDTSEGKKQMFATFHSEGTKQSKYVALNRKLENGHHGISGILRYYKYPLKHTSTEDMNSSYIEVEV